MECSLQPQSTTDGVSVLATMPPTPPPSIDQVVKPTSMDHLVKLRVHAIETCKTNGRATFCHHHSVRPKLVGSTEKVVAVGCGSWPQRLAPSAQPLPPLDPRCKTGTAAGMASSSACASEVSAIAPSPLPLSLSLVPLPPLDPRCKTGTAAAGLLLECIEKRQRLRILTLDQRVHPCITT